MKTIDLHVHSTASDGTVSPTDLVAMAAALPLCAFALTDHDTTDGIDEARKAALSLPGAPEVVPGIELSTDFFGTDIHIVGLDLSYQDPAFQSFLASLRQNRLEKNQAMIDRMKHDGIPISYEQMTSAFGEHVWTRAHFARYLLSLGLVSSIPEAFDRYIGDHCPYYVAGKKISSSEAVSVIRRFGGIPVLAHPLQYHFNDTKLRTLIHDLKSAGLIGMEVYYSSYTLPQEQYLRLLAEEFSLLPGGGSDFHGDNKPTIHLGTGTGALAIPPEILLQLRRANSSGLNVKQA